MIGQKTGMTILQSREHVVGERLSAKGRIRGARDRFPAGYCHHVMERRDLPVCAGKRRGIRRVSMEHGAHLRPVDKDIPMETPLTGGCDWIRSRPTL